MELDSREGGRSTLSQINVTPLVDVMLVLLVIFMVTSPMMQQGVRVNLPKAEAKSMAPKEHTLVVSLDKSGRITINGSTVAEGELKERLPSLLEDRAQKEVFLKADKEVPYGDVVRVMAEIKGAGVDRLGMVTDPAGRR